MVSLARAGLACIALVSLAGCAGAPNQPPPAAAASAPYIGLANGTLGASLDAFDKQAADKAEFTALNTGQRRTWRGDDGTYGYVAPGPLSSGCRNITHTVYINGRPTVGTGAACKSGGGWKLQG